MRADKFIPAWPPGLLTLSNETPAFPNQDFVVSGADFINHSAMGRQNPAVSASCDAVENRVVDHVEKNRAAFAILLKTAQIQLNEL